MPEREFEIYLSVLSRLLKLTPEQTAAISDELRDHLEERFEELVRTGLDRDDAITQALDEFGDASGLAVNLTKVSQKPIRRWVIGSTAVTAVALLVGLSAFLTSKPDGPGLPGPSEAVAQSETGERPQIDPQSLLLGVQPDDLALKQLFEPSHLNAPEDAPLQDALAQLAHQHSVPIIIDRVAIEDIGYTVDEPLIVPPLGRPLDAPNDTDPDKESSENWPHTVTLAQTLDVMLDELNLTWTVRNGIITVTTVEAAEEQTSTQSYNIQPLLDAGIAPDTLSTVLMENTNTNWAELDGDGGTLSLLENVLTVRQSYQAHRAVRNLLFKLARPEGTPWIDYAVERESLTNVLKTEISANFVLDFPLQDCIDQFALQFEMPILTDRVALGEIGLTVDVPTNIPALSKVPFESVLDVGLNELELVMQLRHGLPTVTTVDSANDSRRFAVGVYDVQRILDVGIEPSQLADAIRSMSGGRWEQIDGEGGTLTLVETGILVVSQTDEMHRSVQRLLSTWGHALARTQKPSAIVMEQTPITKFYHMPIETAESLKTVIPEMVAANTWQSDANPDGGTIHVVALASRTLKDSSVNENKKSESKDKGTEKKATAAIDGRPRIIFSQFGGGGFGGGGMGGLGGGNPGNHQLMGFYSESTGVLVITQTAQVHREIDRFLASLKVSARGRNEATEVDVRQMGGGGGFF